MTPTHYQGSIEPIEYMRATFTPEEFKGFLKCNIIKYISRAGKKGEENDDIYKAYVYCKWLLDLQKP